MRKLDYSGQFKRDAIKAGEVLQDARSRLTGL